MNLTMYIKNNKDKTCLRMASKPLSNQKWIDVHNIISGKEPIVR